MCVKGRDRRYDWPTVLAWRDARISGPRGGSSDLTDKERKLKAEADLAEMEAAKEAGHLLDAGEVRLRADRRGAWVLLKRFSHAAALHHALARELPPYAAAAPPSGPPPGTILRSTSMCVYTLLTPHARNRL